jgi:uncharacterized protein (DUF2235 family)
MPRNLVICCDGTANEFKKDRTNVLKLAFAASKDPAKQLVYYHPGVGTMAPPAFWSEVGQWFARFAGKVLGYGLKADIRDVYTFIMDHYEKGDRLYIFGFSRGAYTARAVTALLWQFGLMAPGNSATVPYAINLLWKSNSTPEGPKRQQGFQLANEFRQSLAARICRPHFLGVWDTVSSVGWISNPLSLPFTRRLLGAKTIRHAVAIDERRSFFRTNLVELDPARDIREVWFAGVHCDVGGGYAEEESQLAKVPLEWMITEAGNAGMLFEADRVDEVLGRKGGNFVAPDPTAHMHNSLWPIWWIAEFIPKKHWNQDRHQWEPHFNFFRRRKMGVAPVVHDGAWARGKDYVKRLPAQSIRWSAVPPFTAAPKPARPRPAVVCQENADG